jgi:arsenite methyltransferase
MLTEVGFVEIEIGPPVDTFGGAAGETKARTFEVFGYAFRARKPTT